MKKIILSLMFFLFSAGYPVIAADDPVSVEYTQEKTLNLNQCIEIAIYSNPKIQSSIYNTEIFKSKIGQNRSLFIPQITADTSYFRTNPSTENNLSDGSSNNFSTGIQLNQLVYDFGKTPALLKTSKLTFLSSNEDLKNTVRDIIFNVKSNYYKVLLSEEEIKVLEESIKLYERYLDQAKAFYKAGFKAKIDTITAEVTLNKTKLDLIKAKNAMEIAKANLNNSLGYTDAPNYEIEGELNYFDYNVPFEEMVKQAYELRPDLKSANFQKEASYSQLQYEKKNYFPDINAQTSYGARGRFPVDQNWSIGATLSIPVFNGLLTHYKINEAKAQLQKKESDIITLRNAIYLELKEYFLTLDEVKQTIPLSELVVKQAEERLKIADKRYQIGVGNSIELKDAEIELRNAKLSYNRSLYEYNIAIFNIEKSIGKDIPDILLIK